MNIRERLEEMERAQLSPHATLAAESLGRARAVEPDPVRTCFQRDRDRIIHLCRAFRRLANKTQVFIYPAEDHLRTYPRSCADRPDDIEGVAPERGPDRGDGPRP